MSISTLKRKTQHLYNNSSVNRGPNGFSINGTLRSQGYVGQTSLGHSLPRTLARGNTPRGFGGNFGSFQINPPIVSGIQNLNDSNKVKSSVLTTNGMLMTRFRWIRRGEPFATVKPDVNNVCKTQQQYINNISSNNISCIDNNLSLGSKIIANKQNTCKNLTNTQSPSQTCLYTKPSIVYTPKMQSLHILSLNNQCAENNIMNPPNSVCRTPLPGS